MADRDRSTTSSFLGRIVGICYPSFTVAYLLSSGVLAAFVTWALLDASFPCAPYLLIFVYELGIESPGHDVSPLFEWDRLGPRIATFCALVLCGILVHIVVVSRLFVGRSGGRSISAVMLVTALVAGWFCLYVQYDSLRAAGFRLRIHRRFAELRVVGDQLLDKWPSTDGKLPVVGEYRIDSWDNNRLRPHGRPSEEFPWTERIGGIIGIRRGETGIVRLQFEAILRHEYCVEFMPKGASPVSFDHPFAGGTLHHSLTGYVRLDASAYLTWYSQSSSGLFPSEE